MKIGIIGSGAIGRAFAMHIVRSGRRVVLSNRRGPAFLEGLVQEFGSNATAGTPREAAAADVVFLSVPWKQLRAALSDVPPWNHRIVIDSTNPIGPPDYRMAELGGKASSEVVASLVPGARVVKAFNTLAPPLLAADPREGPGRRVIFLSGDDAAAKLVIGELIEALGFASIDLGTLSGGGLLQQFPGGPLPALNLLKIGS